MKCNECNKQMSYEEQDIHSGEDWYARRCISFYCKDCTPYEKKYTVETKSIIIETMLKSKLNILNELGLLFADNYEMTDGYILERMFKPHNKLKKWIKGEKE